jgi:TPR repeat protein
MLAKLGVLGIKGDAEKARSWYRKAESFGIPDASQRLSALANR